MQSYTKEMFDEIKLLSLFSLESNLNGVKIHNNADDSMITAAQRLFDKALISQVDGGYLTDAGRELAEHVQQVLDTLKV